MKAANPITGPRLERPTSRSISKYLAYHEIEESESTYLYSVTKDQFREHVRWLSQHRVDTLPIITFDDGHVSQYDLAFPILEEYSLKSIFFVTVGWTNCRNGYMAWHQLEELSRNGHQIQSHGWSHACLTHCSAAELEVELVRSKCELEDHIGTSVNAISMPGGRWNARVLDACRRAGYERVFNSDPLEVPTAKKDLQLCGRLMISRRARPETIEALWRGGLSTYGLRAKRSMQTAARFLMGDSLYQSLWRKLAHKNQSLENRGNIQDQGTG